MATTITAVRSDRSGGFVTVAGTSSNMDSATTLSESFMLPPGFGDALIYAGVLLWVSLETIVAAGAARGPSVIVSQAGGALTDPVPWAEWRRLSATGLHAAAELTRPVLWRAEEVLFVSAFGEDTGAADTSDLTAIIRVLRLRNLGA